MYDFISGKIKYRITCHCPEALINKMRYLMPVNNIIKIDKSVVEFTTGYRYRHTVSRIAGEYDATVEKIWEYGITVILDKYKKRVGLWIGMLASILIVSIGSNMIWEIKVSGNENVPSDDIIRQLKTLGIAEGKFINKDMLETAYNSFLINEPRISWISVNYDGTIAKVEVKETKVVPERPDRNRNINIVAKCDGQIRRVDVFDGTAEVVPGDVVTKGQLLVSSFVETRKTGEYMRAARGNVWASTVRKYKIVIQKNQNIFKNAERVTSKCSFELLGKKIPLYINKNIDIHNLETNFKTERVSIFDYIRFPMRLEKQVYNRIIYENVDLTYLAAKKLANKELNYRIERDLQNAEIIEREEACVEGNDSFVFNYELLCIENISVGVDFEFKEK